MLVQINKTIGWIVCCGILIAETQQIIYGISQGRMMIFIPFLTGLMLTPYLISSIAAVLNRESSGKKIKSLLLTSILISVLYPFALPMFFDKDLVYLSIIGLVYIVLMIAFRKKLEYRLIIQNCIGVLHMCFVLLLR